VITGRHRVEQRNLANAVDGERGRADRATSDDRERLQGKIRVPRSNRTRARREASSQSAGVTSSRLEPLYVVDGIV